MAPVRSSVMPVPAGLKLHKASGQYRAWIHGAYRYFGKEPSAATQRYGLALSGPAPTVPTVALVVAEIQSWADRRYPPSGRWGGSAKVLRAALRFLDTTVVVRIPPKEPQSVFLPSLPVAELSCIHLEAVRRQMIDDRKSRNYINAQIRRIQQGFKQMRPLGLVSSAVVADLQALTALPRGHAGVCDTAPVGPVDESTLQAIIPHLSAPMAAVCRILSITGMRVSECLAMRVSMLDTCSDPWVYDLGMKHKGRNSGKAKRIYLGPDSQQILRPLLEAAKATMQTRAPLFPALSIRNTSDTISVSSVRDAIEKACDAARMPQFTTHQIRHRHATEIIEREALKLVQAALGHESQSSSRVYAELDAIQRERARLRG